MKIVALEDRLRRRDGPESATLVVVAATMLAAAVVAALVPTLRAARVDPAIALLGE